MGNEAWSKIQLHGNLELKNLMTLYILNLRTNLEHFLESITYILYIVSKLGKSKVQNASNSLQIRAKMKKLWPFEDNCTKLEGHFEMISKFNLWIRNPLRNDTNFKFTHCHFDVPPPLPWELHLFDLWIQIHFDMTPISNSPTTTLMFRLLYLENCI